MRPVDDDATWQLRVNKLDTELRELCKEAVDDGRLDRLEQFGGKLFELRQQMLDVAHIHRQGEKAMKPYPWWARDWMRSQHWLIFAELVAREDKMKRIRNRLMGLQRDRDVMQPRDDEPKRLIDRFTFWLFQLRD